MTKQRVLTKKRTGMPGQCPAGPAGILGGALRCMPSPVKATWWHVLALNCCCCCCCCCRHLGLQPGLPRVPGRPAHCRCCTVPCAQPAQHAGPPKAAARMARLLCSALSWPVFALHYSCTVLRSSLSHMPFPALHAGQGCQAEPLPAQATLRSPAVLLLLHRAICCDALPPAAPRCSQCCLLAVSKASLDPG